MKDGKEAVQIVAGCVIVVVALVVAFALIASGVYCGMEAREAFADGNAFAGSLWAAWPTMLVLVFAMQVANAIGGSGGKR